MASQIVYTTWHVETALALLDTTEDSVVMKALINLTLYAGFEDSYMTNLWKWGLLNKLLNLLTRHVCIKRLVLKFLLKLVKIPEVMSDLDQKTHDKAILKISDIYMKNKDPYVQLYSVSLLGMLVKSCRIMELILVYEAALFKVIVKTITRAPDDDLLEETLDLFLSLMNAPVMISSGPQIEQFNITHIVEHLQDEDSRMLRLCLGVLNKLSFYFPYAFENSYIKHKIVQCMLNVFMNPKMEQYHEVAADTVTNCLVSGRVCHKFLKNLEFLQFFQWLRQCDPKYHFQSIVFLERLTRIPNQNQLLLDFFMESSMVGFLRSSEKKVINKLCQAIINMNTHIFCLENIVTPELLKRLFKLLIRSDEEDPWNEVVLNTILDFAKKSPKTLNIIQQFGLHKILVNYFHNTFNFLSQESQCGLLEMLFNMSLNSVFREDIIRPEYVADLLYVLDTKPPLITRYVCRILSNFVGCPEFRTALESHEGHQMFLNILKNPTDLMLLQEVLIFIRTNLQYEDVVDSVFDHKVVYILKKFSEILKAQVPLVTKLLTLVYNHHPSLKFFETKKLDVTDKLGDKFCLINGCWRSDFPTLEDFTALPISPEYTVYLVDYSFNSTNIHQEDASVAQVTSDRDSNNPTRHETMTTKNYKVYPDPFLPKLVSLAATFLANCSTLKQKVQFLATFVNSIMSTSQRKYNSIDKVHNVMLHVAFLKTEVGNNVVPIGHLKQGSYCERSLLFKAIADVSCIPSTLVKGNFGMYWNEVPLFDEMNESPLTFYVVDLIKNVGNLMDRESGNATLYCTGKI